MGVSLSTLDTFASMYVTILTLVCCRYCVAKADVQIKVPENMSDEGASTLGVGVVTVGQGLYQSLGLPLPGSGKYARGTHRDVSLYETYTSCID